MTDFSNVDAVHPIPPVPLILRDYQDEAVSAVEQHLATQDTNPCVVIPTGGGKTLVIATLCQNAVHGRGGRVLVLAHRRELLEQSREKLALLAPDLDCGVYSAGLGRRDTEGHVILAGIQSVYRRAEELGRFDLVCVDEAHLIPPDGEGMYRRFLTEARELHPALRVVGFTATPFRMGSGLICGPDRILHSICYEIGVGELIERGFLSPLSSKGGTPAAVADTSGVPVRGGEFVGAALEDAMAQGDVVRAAVRETLALAKDRRRCLIFACGVKHAERIRQAVESESSEPVRAVYSDTEPPERRRVLEEFRSETSSFRFLVNVNVLTEGFDAPNVDCVVLLRATQSPGLYAQMVGRGLRRHSRKENCLVLDFGENILRHGPIDQLHVPRRSGKRTSAVVVKACPACQENVPAGTRTCPDCGYEWPVSEPRHAVVPASARVLSSDVRHEWHQVKEVAYYVHNKRGAPVGHPQSLRVDYSFGFYQEVSEWVCVAHPRRSHARRRAEQWWSQRADQRAFPQSALDAVASARSGGLRAPRRILVTTGGRYDKVVDYDFSPDDSAEAS